MELDALILLFLAEALAGLTLLMAILLWRQGKRSRRECLAAEHLIGRIRRQESERSRKLEELLGEICSLPAEEPGALPQEVGRRERALYRQILKLFLERDTRLLPQVEEHIRALGEPYEQLLRDISPARRQGGSSATAEEPAAARTEIDRLRMETEHLAEQLRVALETIDRLSSEYSRLFAPDRTGAELEASRRRIIETLRRNEHRIRKISPAHPGKEGEEDIIITLDPSP